MKPETKELIDHLVKGVAEGLKFIPDGETDEAVEYAIDQLSAADVTGKPNIVTIIHSAVHSGKIIAKSTPTPKDDKFFGILDNVVENYQENGEKAIGAIFEAIFQKVKKD